MTLDQFNQLAEDQQAFSIEQWGVCIAARDYGECKLLLYQIDSFYVEVFWDHHNRCIRKFQSFASTDPLDPYISKIKIEGLF